MGWRDRERRPGRRAAFRDPRPIMLIVCEGRNTEPQYFEQFAIYHKNSRVRVKIADETGVPFSLVRAAKEYKRDAERAARRERDANLEYDSVWCVFDIDDHPKVHEAREMAAANGIHTAISNPCIELWLILHFRESPGMQHRHAMKKILEIHVPGYDKKVDYKLYAEGYEQAVVRAKRLEAIAEAAGTPGCNPTSDVYRLTESILQDERTPEPATDPVMPREGTAHVSPPAGQADDLPDIPPEGGAL